MDRHATQHGAYWKSYDFKTNLDRGNLFLNPLGPQFAGNPFADLAFEQAGGEQGEKWGEGGHGFLTLTDGASREEFLVR